MNVFHENIEIPLRQRFFVAKDVIMRRGALRLARLKVDLPFGQPRRLQGNSARGIASAQGFFGFKAFGNIADDHGEESASIRFHSRNGSLDGKLLSVGAQRRQGIQGARGAPGHSVIPEFPKMEAMALAEALRDEL